MKAKWILLAFVVLGLVVAPSAGFAVSPPAILTTQGTAYSTFISTNGELGLFLIGTWDSRQIVGEAVTTIVQLVNPHPADRWAFVTFWGQDETPLQCNPVLITKNGLGEVTVGGLISTYDHGAIKVLVTNSNGNPDIGLVGYRKEIHAIQVDVTAFWQSEIRLQPIPPKVAFADKDGTLGPDEIAAIKTLCEPGP